jgi:hypothetical protein
VRASGSGPHRRCGERGAALVEAAIVLPLIMLVTFGAIEFGIGFTKKAGLEAIARSGARAGAAASADPNLAADVAQAINAALRSSSLPELEWMVVYRIPGDGSSPDETDNGGGPGCATNSSSAQDCAIFFFRDGQFDTSNYMGGWDTDPAVRVLCPSQGNPPDRIAVKIYGEFHYLTNMFGHGGVAMTSESILQLEPNNC